VVAPQYSSDDAARIKSLLLRGLSVNEVAEATGFTAYTVTAAVFATEGMTIPEFRHANHQTSPPTQVALPTAPKPLLPRTRIPVSAARKSTGKLAAKTCPFCRQPFTPRKESQKFCSHSCSSKATVPRKRRRRVKISKTCENCGAPYDTFRPAQRYCKDACRIARISADKTWLTEIPCQFCDKLFRPPQRGYKFCSRPCAYKGKAAGSFVRGSVAMPDGARVAYIGTYELVFLLYAAKHPQEFPHVAPWSVGVPYELDGKKHTYYPDFLVESDGRQPLMVELKSSRTIEFSQSRHEAKVAAAQAWCASNAHDYLLLGEWDDAFRRMCDFVREHHNLDALAQRSREDSKVEDRYCIECGRLIPRKSPAVYRTRVFCSKDCRNKSDKRKKPVMPSSRHTCPTCEKPFTGWRLRKYCSKACYTAAQKTLSSRPCAVCGTTFQPTSAKSVACGLECGTIYRAASRTGLTVDAYRERQRAEVEALPAEAICSRCEKAFKPTLDNRKHCRWCRDSGGDAWTLETMLARLKAIRQHLGGRVPSYSEIYHDADLKARFNSCSLAGALYRFNQDNDIASFADFCEQYLGWEVPRKLTKAQTARVLEKLAQKCGGVPTGLSRMASVLGYRGMTLLAAVRKHFGKSLDEYCAAKKLKRVSASKASRSRDAAKCSRTSRPRKSPRRHRKR
jgi:hypothetical protein